MSRPVKRALTHRFSRPLDAVATAPVGPAQPGHAHPLTVIGLADDLVAEDDRPPGSLDLPVAEMQVRPADRACPDREAQLPGAGLGVGQVAGRSGSPGASREGRTHVRDYPRVARVVSGYDIHKRDENQDKPSESAAEREDENKSKHKAPFMPDSEDDTPLGSTDQHSDA